MAQTTSIGTFAGILTKRGHRVIAVLHRSDLAFEGIDKPKVQSIEDMMRQIGETVKSKYGSKVFEHILDVLHLTHHVEVFDVLDDAKNAQEEHLGILSGFHSYLDTRYAGYESHFCLSHSRIGTKTAILLLNKPEPELIALGLPHYQAWNARQIANPNRTERDEVFQHRFHNDGDDV